MPPSFLDRTLRANVRYAARRHTVPGTFAPRAAIVLCMDARLDPVQFLGLKYGDAHIIRNAGGRVREAVRSLVISQALFGTQEVAIIHHTECGLLGASQAEIEARVKDARGVDAGGLDYLTMSGLEESVRDDLALYRATPLLRQDIAVRGFVLDVHTGRLAEVG